MVEVILGVAYLLVAIGTALGSYSSSAKNQVIEIAGCSIIGLFWPVFVGGDIGKGRK
jgi:hypothetical protein